MARATATLTSCGDAVFRNCNHPELLARWRAAVPEDARTFDPRRGRWWFSAEYVDLALALAERYTDVELVDGPHWRSSTCPCQRLVYRLHRLSGVA